VNVGRARKVASSVAVAAAAVFGACAPNSAVMRSNHYQLAVPKDWQATEEGGVAVLHVPQAANAPGGKLDLRVHAWLLDRTVDQPVQESLDRLAKLGAAPLQPAGDAAEEACGELAHDFSLFGHAQSAAHMRTASGDYVVVTAAQTSGSLVAAVGVVPNDARVCENLHAMTAAIASLQDRLTPADDPTVPGRPPIQLDSPIAGRPSTVIPAPNSTP